MEISLDDRQKERVMMLDFNMSFTVIAAYCDCCVMRRLSSFLSMSFCDVLGVIFIIIVIFK